MSKDDEKIEKILGLIADLGSALEAMGVKVKHDASEISGVNVTEATAVKEETFTILKFEPQIGAKIGDFEVAYKPNNIEDKWTYAFNILRNSNATIQSRYYGEGYQFSYWLYGEGKIYRQKLKRS